MERTGVQLLWGTARLFHHPRYIAGAATNPDPDVFAHAAAQVRTCLDVTHRWVAPTTSSGAGAKATRRCSTPICPANWTSSDEFLRSVVEHKHKIGFSGTLLIEPKPQEPTKHQYDYDSATVFGFLQRVRTRGRDQGQHRGEPRHALGGHDFDHEVAVAQSLGHLRIASTRTAATTGSAGTPTSSRTRSTPSCPRSTRSCGAVDSTRAGSCSTPNSGACRSPGRPVPRPRRRHRHPGQSVPRRARHGAGPAPSRPFGPSATPAGRAPRAERSSPASAASTTFDPVFRRQHRSGAGVGRTGSTRDLVNRYIERVS